MAGTLSATITQPASAVTAAFGGSGSLGVQSLTPVYTVSAALAGAGALTATNIRTAAVSAALSGSGTLSATNTFNMASSAALSGSGTLSATISAVSTLVQMQYVSSAAAASNTVALPTHAAGDFIIAFAFRDGSTTKPAAAGGTWVGVTGSITGTTCSSRTEAKLALTSSETTGTWTNATGVVIVVYRGCAGVPAASWGNNNGSSSTIDYPGLAAGFQTIGPLSWLARFAGHRTATNLLTNTPAGFTARNGVATECRAIDSNGGTSDDTHVTQSVNASSGWQSNAAELLVMGSTLLSSLTNTFSSAFDSNWTVTTGTAGSEYTIAGGKNTISGAIFDSSPTIGRWINDTATFRVLSAGDAGTAAMVGININAGSTTPEMGWLVHADASSTQPFLYTTGEVGTPITHTSGNYYRIENSGGNISWKYSTNGTSWTTNHSIALSTLQTGNVYIGGQAFMSVDGGGASNFELDSINL